MATPMMSSMTVIPREFLILFISSIVNRIDLEDNRLTRCDGSLISFWRTGVLIQPGLSLIIPTYQNASGLRFVLQSIQQIPCPVDYEILVVANLEDLEVKTLVSEFSQARYLSTGLVGVNHARNLGLQQARFEFSYFFDDDCVLVDSDFFSCLLTEFQTMAQTKSFVGGPYLLKPNSGVCDQAYFQIQQQWLQLGLLDATGRCAFLLGGNFGGRTLEMRKHLFDPMIVFGGSETEFFLRLYRIGFVCRYSTKLRVLHQTSLTAKKLMIKAYKQGRGAAYLRRHSLDFQSNYLQPQMQLERNPSVRLWKNIYGIVFHMSYLWHLPSPAQLHWLRTKILNYLQKPELLRRNIMSRFVALIGLHLNSKK